MIKLTQKHTLTISILLLNIIGKDLTDFKNLSGLFSFALLSFSL